MVPQMDSSDAVPGNGRPPRVPLLGRTSSEGQVHHQHRAPQQPHLRLQHEYRPQRGAVSVKLDSYVVFAHEVGTPTLYMLTKVYVPMYIISCINYKAVTTQS